MTQRRMHTMSNFKTIGDNHRVVKMIDTLVAGNHREDFCRVEKS
jgi:hypothetical protein